MPQLYRVYMYMIHKKLVYMSKAFVPQQCKVFQGILSINIDIIFPYRV